MHIEGQSAECRNLPILTDLWDTNWKSGSQKPNTEDYNIMEEMNLCGPR